MYVENNGTIGGIDDCPYRLRRFDPIAKQHERSLAGSQEPASDPLIPGWVCVMR